MDPGDELDIDLENNLVEITRKCTSRNVGERPNIAEIRSILKNIPSVSARGSSEGISQSIIEPGDSVPLEKSKTHVRDVSKISDINTYFEKF